MPLVKLVATPWSPAANHKIPSNQATPGRGGPDATGTARASSTVHSGEGSKEGEEEAEVAPRVPSRTPALGATRDVDPTNSRRRGHF
jgi:hypothetical protein